MNQRELGKDGLQVGAIGLGTGPMCVTDNRPSLEDATRVLTRAAELGVTLWDTADAYCLDESEMGYGERLLAQALSTLPADLRERVVIATKGGTIRPQGRWEQNGASEYLRGAIDASLRALNTERIDLWQWHAPDAKVPFEDSISVISEAHQTGKIRHVGLSNVSVAQIETARQIVPITSVQNRYGFHSREPENNGVLEKCQELGIAFLPYSPLGGMSGASDLEKNGVLSEVASELGVSPQRVVLAWLLGKYEKMIPIPGVRRIETLEDSARAADVVLSSEQQSRLDASKQS